MALKQQLKNLANVTDIPCVTISFNTHRTHPDNEKDAIILKKLCVQAEERVIKEYGKREVSGLLEKIRNIPNEVDINYNLDSLHIFLSENVKEIVRSAWPTAEDLVHISNSFAVKPIIKAANRNEEYYILSVSQSGAFLYEALSYMVVEEIKNEDFPFPENTHAANGNEAKSDGKQVDNMVREYLNKIDKAVVKLHNQSGFPCVVICTENNYSRLLQVADKPDMYLGYSSKDYQNRKPHQLVEQAWEIVCENQKIRKASAISEMKEAVAHGKVLTDLQEIHQAALDGLADLMIVHNDFKKTVRMHDERTFTIIEDATEPGAIDDITSNIAWNVFSKGGRTVFTNQDEIKDLGEIVLKTRY